MGLPMAISMVLQQHPNRPNRLHPPPALCLQPDHPLPPNPQKNNKIRKMLKIPLHPIHNPPPILLHNLLDSLTNNIRLPSWNAVRVELSEIWVDLAYIACFGTCVC